MKTLNLKTIKAKTLKNKTAMILLTSLLVISMFAAFKPAAGQVYFPVGTHVPSYAQINVAPNPVGIGQTVTVNMYLAVPLETSGNTVTTDRGSNFTLYITDPNGVKSTLGPFTADATGGTYYAFAPSILGNYSIYWYYPGQVLTGNNNTRNGWGGLITDPSTSSTITLTVQQEPISRSSYAVTPLPNNWWETPMNAENIQEWSKMTGPWLGLSANSFASTGSYNTSTYCNPYTQSVVSGHVIWTLPWGAGGIPGGDFGGTEDQNFWTTRQYSPNFAPVIMNGIMYSTQYTFGASSGANNGIIAVNLFTGQQLWAINTTNTLRCGMMFTYKNPNQYGVVGPFLWTTGNLPVQDTGGINIQTTYNSTGTQWNMYDAFDGRYVLSIYNGTGLTLSTDDQGGLIGYFLNNTVGSEIVHATQLTPGVYTTNVTTNSGPHLDMFNFTTALCSGVGLNFQPNRNSFINWQVGMQFAAPVPTNISGAAIVPALAINTVTENYVALTGGFIHGQGVGGEQAGWLVIAAMNGYTGAQVFVKNVTTADTAVMDPFTRLTYTWGAGKLFIFDGFNWKGVAYDMATGAKLWDMQLVGPTGYQINPYDVFNFKAQYANGVVIVLGFGGDLWGVNATTGQQMWATNTNIMAGDPGIETPYGTWPLWVFACQAQDANLEYCAIGHEYNPPLFHGAQLLAVNMTNGNLVWSELGFYTRAMVIAQNTLITCNSYDNQVYAFAKGPTAITVEAPSVGVTTATPITITGSIKDISPGTSQDAVARNFPNGVPVVSDSSESHWMEYVYQQQLMPANATGVPITISVLDANNNYRAIGTVTSNTQGTFGFTWTPDIPGDFTVYASFAGSNSYYPSSAATQMHAALPPTTAPTATTQANVATTGDLMTYVVASAIAIIIVIAIVGVLIVMMLRKRA